MSFYIDVHTHKPIASLRQLQILNPLLIELGPEGFEAIGPFTLGIHPWHVEEIVEEDAFKLICHKREDPFFMGIGEIGLDRSIDASFELQERIFSEQVELAKKFEVEAIIIHCVRAFPDIIRIIKQSQYRGSLIFHDYNGNPEVTSQLLKHNSFFCFGAKLFKEESSGFKSFSHIPNHRLLFETDDMVDKKIEDIYGKANSILGLKMEDLQNIILENCETAFGKCLPLSNEER